MLEKSNKRKIKKKIIIESSIVFFIAITPFLYKLYDYLPENPQATISFLGITIGNNGFPDISTFVWFLMGKIVPLYLLVFWFFTSKNWWYHILLIPIAMYAFQIFEVLFSNDDDIDTENIFWLLPVCMVVIPFVYFIRIKLYDKYVNGIDLEAMEAELNDLKQKERSRDIKKPKKSDFEQDDFDNSNTSPQESLSDKLDREFSTDNIKKQFTKFQNTLKSWLF
ncbi:hypothetical protein [Costertonia aggregata]|uniref:Uncharacterized protein n=1 Tax=Costertonia aggregata TaxID=343403 RepID=A0A7H9AUD1_9FLAO|nr:hypothetical protein [Costertonia aggregata]QLG47069.1 hypothetical protein HYG79_17470 [Costertonia aggregata]